MLPNFILLGGLRRVLNYNKDERNIIVIYKKTHSTVFLIERKYANKEDSTQEFPGLSFCPLALSVSECLNPPHGLRLNATFLL